MSGRCVACCRSAPRASAYATILVLLSYLLSAGGGEGYAFFWFYAVPVFTLTLFGQREGTVWALMGLAGAGAALATRPDERLEPESVWRFLVTYVLVLIFSYGLESARYRGYSQVLAAFDDILFFLAATHPHFAIHRRRRILPYVFGSPSRKET